LLPLLTVNAQDVPSKNDARRVPPQDTTLIQSATEGFKTLAKPVDTLTTKDITVEELLSTPQDSLKKKPETLTDKVTYRLPAHLTAQEEDILIQ
jgi:hypothetical protein